LLPQIEIKFTKIKVICEIGKSVQKSQHDSSTLSAYVKAHFSVPLNSVATDESDALTQTLISWALLTVFFIAISPMAWFRSTQ